jgi:hypothetical protein
MEVCRRVVTLWMMLELGRGGDKAMGPEADRAKRGIILRSHVDVGVVAQDVAGHNIARSDRRRSLIAG